MAWNYPESDKEKLLEEYVKTRIEYSRLALRFRKAEGDNMKQNLILKQMNNYELKLERLFKQLNIT